MDHRTVGVLGGGQLGRMMAEAGHRLGIKLAIVDPGGSQSPAGQIAELSIEGSFTDSDKIRELSIVSDVITTEIEHVNCDILQELERKGHVVNPNSQTISLIQNKYNQKVHLSNYDIPLPEFMDITLLEDCYTAGLKFGYPYMLKNKKLAYDGRGNAVVHNYDSVSTAYNKLGQNDLYAEKWVPFVKEIAVMIVRTKDGTISYPVVETIQNDNICHIVIAPAQISTHSMNSALSIALKAIQSFSGLGIYGVELFLLPDESILLNEVAPRPHNSGHYTMEACDIDQFEMHLRAILHLPCPKPQLIVGCAIMINILGLDTMEDTKQLLTKALNISGAGVHWYGKSENRKGRKMAHMTITADSISSLSQKIELLDLNPIAYGLIKSGPRVGIIMGSDSDLETMKEAAIILDLFSISYELTVVSAHRTPTRMYTYAQTAVDRGIEVIIAGAGGAAHLPGMVAALTSLPVIGVPVKTSTMNGQDSLLSIVQMPKGIPVATVAIGNAANAGLLAIRIIGSKDYSIQAKMDEYMAKQEEEVLQKASKLESIGYNNYLSDILKK